jgi:diadenosine tetraphosphate (Ap4A) HIT family hydrolase
MNASAVWSLDPRLERDTRLVGDLQLARALVMNDANYPWLILVPRHPGASELLDLDDEQQAQLMDEIVMLSRVLKDVTACDKLNIAAIGNIVPQLHVHLVARRRSDPAWPRPVWGAVPARPYGEDELAGFIKRIRQEVAFG